jgi:hypothetical protein
VDHRQSVFYHRGSRRTLRRRSGSHGTHIRTRTVGSRPIPLWLALKPRRLSLIHLWRAVVAWRSLHAGHSRARHARGHGPPHLVIHRHATAVILVRTWGNGIVSVARMLVAIIGIICRGRAGFGLTFEITEGLFGREGNHGVLTVDLLLRKVVHAQSHAGFRAQGDDAKAFGLSIGAVLKKLHLVEVIHADVVHRIGNILICSPLKQTVSLGAPSNAIRTYPS